MMVNDQETQRFWFRGHLWPNKRRRISCWEDFEGTTCKKMDWNWEGGARLFVEMRGGKMRDNGRKLKHEKFRKTSTTRTDRQLKQVAWLWGGCAVFILCFQERDKAQSNLVCPHSCCEQDIRLDASEVSFQQNFLWVYVYIIQGK